MSAVWDYLRVYAENNVLSVIKNMNGWDVLDIFLLTLILFFVYRLVRDRRAGKLLVGLGVVFALSLLSDVLELSALQVILGDFQQIGFLAVLILFQPELRSALEKVGEKPLTGIRSITSESRDLAALNANIDAVCTAVSDMSREKVGALIVLERSTKLGEYINSGVVVDAAISPHILRNLFFNKAPLHDGAVILRSGRVCAAGCFLPLSMREDINKDLGTRHRAAIGLSEISDAIVIVVSEETGVISLSVDGDLERNYNYNSLKQALNGMLAPQGNGEGAKKLRKEKGARKKKS